MKFTLFTADCSGNAANTVYPNKKVITAECDLKKAVAFDHVCAEYKNNIRGEANFIIADVVPMDCALIGTKIWELPIPKSAMVVSVVRSGNTLIPDEDLELKYADELFIIMNQNTYPDDNQKIESLIYNNWKEE